MKFARYLKDTQIPEWKRAYIDYRGLKKQIKAIRRSRLPSSTFLPIESDSDRESPGDSSDNPPQPVASGSRDHERTRAEIRGEQSQGSPATGSSVGHGHGHGRSASRYGSTGYTPPLFGRERDGHILKEVHDQAESNVQVKRNESPPPVELPQPALPTPSVMASSTVKTDRSSGKGKYTHDTTRSNVSVQSILSVSNSVALHGQHARSRLSLAKSKGEQPLSSEQKIGSAHGSQLSITFKERPDITTGASQTNQPTTNATGVSTSRKFFANVKRRASGRHFSVSSFTSPTPPQILPLSAVLPTLSTTERSFFEKLDRELDKVETFYRNRESEAISRQSALKEQLRELQDHRRAFYRAKSNIKGWTNLPVPLPQSVTKRFANAYVTAARQVHITEKVGSRIEMKVKKEVQLVTDGDDEAGPSDRDDFENPPRSARKGPDEYKPAKKELKKAMLEHYRGLELLNNYRVLNITGFRKALKKFEKVTKVAVQTAYMQERVEVSAFASGEVIGEMLKEMEELFASRFVGGDMKKARTRLRAMAKHKSHHFSTFRTGAYLGLAFPAFVHGLVQSFRPSVREELPWDSLLVIYAAFLFPAMFPLLVGLNIGVWARSRINYGFIFELDFRRQLDYREYFELPALLLCLLCYAFWLTFNNIGSDFVPATAWPLVWVVLAVAIIANPLRMFFPSARWWIIRKVGRQIVSGTQPVEFTDFWLGDQFCSLIFTLSNLYFVGCAYHISDWDEVMSRCTISHTWGYPFLLGILPLAIRAIQSVKRYADSKLYTHLINGGKYVSSILFYLFYFIWRHQGRPRNIMFVLFCLVGTASSVYSTSWDLLMDWSFFKTPAQHPFLRKELIYHNNYHIYYIAIITNIIIRFIWVIYIPHGGMNITLRTFIVAFLEMLRRWQWNFFRLENEHIGNTDQYRVTREVPLPYSFDDVERESEDDADEDEPVAPKSSWRKSRSIRMPSLSRTRDMDRNASAHEET